MVYEKTYIIVRTWFESEGIAVVELLDKTSPPSAVKTAVLRMSPEEYATSLNSVPIGTKVKLTLSQVQEVVPPL